MNDDRVQLELERKKDSSFGGILYALVVFWVVFGSRSEILCSIYCIPNGFSSWTMSQSPQKKSIIFSSVDKFRVEMIQS